MRAWLVWMVVLLTGIFAGAVMPVVSTPDALVFQGTAMVPLRPMAELLGAELSAAGDAVTVRRAAHAITFRVNSSTAQVDGEDVALPLAPFTRVGVTYVPLRPLTTALGGTLVQDGSVLVVTSATSTLRLPMKLQSCQPSAYRDDDWEIYVTTLDGTDRKRLTYNTDDEHTPDISADGKVLLYQQGAGIVKRTMDNPTEQQLLTEYRQQHPQSVFTTPRLSPDGSLLVCTEEIFTDQNATVPTKWYLLWADKDGAEANRLCEGEDPRFSPDGQWITFAGGSDSPLKLCLWHQATNQRYELSSGSMPLFSPDSSMLYYIRDDQYSLQPQNGQQYASLEGCKLEEGHPGAITRFPVPAMTDGCAISPDGQRLVFDYRDENKPGIYSIRNDGTDLQRLTDAPFEGISSFTPDGKHILFVRMFDLWSAKVTGADQHCLAKDMLIGGDYCCSPDSKYLYFTAYPEAPEENGR